MKFIIGENDKTRLEEAVAALLDEIDVENCLDVGEKLKDNFEIIKNILDNLEELDRSKIADKLEIDSFRETLRDCYDYYVSDLSDEDIESILDDIANIVANDDCYNDTYNDAVRTVAKRNNLKYVGDDEWGDEK